MQGQEGDLPRDQATHPNSRDDNAGGGRFEVMFVCIAEGEKRGFTSFVLLFLMVLFLFRMLPIVNNGDQSWSCMGSGGLTRETQIAGIYNFA